MTSPMNEPLPQVIEADEEISLLDLLQVIADNLRLLILAPWRPACWLWAS